MNSVKSNDKVYKVKYYDAINTQATTDIIKRIHTNSD